MQTLDIDDKLYWWFVNTRRFGTVSHIGFGLDCLVQFVTGILNIRDIIPFPRNPKNAKF